LTDAAFLSKFDLFNGLTPSQLQAVTTVCREVAMNRGDTILNESGATNDVYMIVQGEVEVVLGVQGAQGAELHPSSRPASPVSVGRLGAGQMFGEMALVDQGPRSATVRCVADATRLLAMQRGDFIRLCEEDHLLGYVVMRNIAADLAFKLRTRNLARI
jgi:CRP/FNR family transcriptional regulator, cyclic AMP receptor protein